MTSSLTPLQPCARRPSRTDRIHQTERVLSREVGRLIHPEADATATQRGYRRNVTLPQPPTRHELMLAFSAAAWTGVFLSPHWLWVAVLVPAYAAAVLPCRRSPVIAGYAVVGAELTQWALDVPSDNPANLFAILLTVFCLGRYGGGIAAVAPVALLALAMTGRDGFAVPTGAFVTVVLAGIWTLGVLVRRRTKQAHAAWQAVTDLAGTDPVSQAAWLVAEERARLAGEALAVVRGAVESMQHKAEAAGHDLDPAALAGIQADGRRAVAELRRLLGLLRSEQASTRAPDSKAEPAPVRRPPWRFDALVAGGAGAIVIVEAATFASAAGRGSVALSLALCASLALRRTHPSLACLAALLPTALALGLELPLLYGMETPIVMTLLAWSVGVDGRPGSNAALMVWAVVALVGVHLHSPGNEAIMLAYLAVGAMAGRLWGASRREERSSLDTAEELQARHAAVAERAVIAERLRLARELHDVASHAIGVMVLQAGAADAQRTRDPHGAKAALAAVRTAGAQAMSELAVLFGLLDAGAVGVPGLATAAPAADLADAVQTLVERARTGGLDASLVTVGDLTGDLVPAGTAYRVVQEALTNAARHAPGSRVDVQLARDGGALVIDVRDDGPGSDHSTGGFGLVGLAERVRAEGGEVAAGPRPTGGFAVSVRLPLRTQQATLKEPRA
jgi:signal transduction histidine kinase